MSTEYCLSVIRLEGLQWKRNFHSRTPNLYVEVKLGHDTRRTRTIEKSISPAWDEHLIFSSSDKLAAFSIRVMHESSWKSDPCVGYVKVELAKLLAKCANSEASFSISPSASLASIGTTGSIILRFEAIDLIDGAKIMLSTTEKDIENRGIAQSDVAANIAISANDKTTRLGNGDDLYQAVGDLLSRLDTFKKVIDSVSEMHPFLIIAWSVTSGLLQAISHVFETDAKVVNLVRSMGDAFGFVCDVETLSEKARNLQDLIAGLLKQTIECCFFVRQYTGRGFIGRMLNIRSSEKANEFERALADFKEKIESGVIIHTAIVSLRTSQRIDVLLLRQLLNPSTTDTFDRPVCLSGTRQELQRQILEWIFSDTKQNILWLHGVAGSGKSTICATVTQHLRDMSRLGAYIFFEREKSDPSSVIRTVAYKLALFDSAIGSSILAAIDRDKDIISAFLGDQFNKLLFEPLSSTARSTTGPIVILLDALDECGTSQSRKSLIQLIGRHFSRLPNNFRFLISSRREPDIDGVLSSQQDSVVPLELDYASSTSQQDVHSYLCTEMDEAVKKRVELPKGWPWDEKMVILSKAAGGLFIWASTAVKMVSDGDNPFYMLNSLVTNSSMLAGFGLDELYATVLRNSGITWTDERSKDRFCKVLGLVILSKSPLTIKDINGFLAFPPEETSLLILSRLRCVLTYSPSGPISLFHTSFSDYLTSAERGSDPWFIDIPMQQHFIATRCFSIMEDMLHFNMCDLETSFIRNHVVPDLEERIKNNITTHLEYACLHWSHHLSESPCSPAAPELFDKLSDFAYRRLLFWFEVLSLVKVFHRLASPALLDAANWAAKRDANISSFLSDAGKLASEFAFPISQATPHIYISMIGLRKNESEVSAYYSRRMSSLIHVESIGQKKPRRWLKVLEGHHGEVWSAAVSPDGRRIASASSDNTIRLFDFEIATEKYPPLTGHSDSVCSVTFSPDGTCLVSGSADGTLRIWDSQDSSLTVGPLERHTDIVWSVAYSPDGKKIASGSADKTVIIWRALTGEMIAGPFQGHTDIVRSIAFHPDSTRLASGSFDTTIRIWNVETGELVLDPFTGHTAEVYSVTFSPNGENIISGSQDYTIRVWEVEKGGNVVYGPFLDTIMSVAYSSCGKWIVSGSADNTICVRNARSGDIVSGPFEGHADCVSSVTFSPDGAHVVSGSWDSTIRIWSTTQLEGDTGPFSGHKGAVTCALFSTDGCHVASASFDGSILTWDVRSGKVVAGPSGNHSRVYSIAFSSDNSRLVSGSDDCKVRIWNVESGKIVCNPLEGHTREVRCVALSPDGLEVVSGSRDETIRVWDMADGKLLAGPLKGHLDTVWSISYSPNGRLLVSGSSDGTIRIWDTQHWTPISEALKGHKDRVLSVTFSPDGQQIASGSRDMSVIIWSTENGQIVGGPFHGHINSVRSVIYSLDGMHVLSGSEDRTIRVWNIRTGQIICAPLEGHSSTVRSLTLSPDSTRLASCSWDKTIRVWDMSGILMPRRQIDKSNAAASSNNNSSVDWVLGENGWVLGGRDHRELLLWIPPDLRRTLWSPQNTAVFSCEFSTKLDFTGAALGERWTECFMP